VDADRFNASTKNNNVRRRFYNMSNVYKNYHNLPQKLQKEFFKLFCKTKKSQLCIHNLTDKTIPMLILMSLSLGIKYSFSLRPNFFQLNNAIADGISWKDFLEGIFC